MRDGQDASGKGDVKSEIARLLIEAMKEERAPWQRPWNSVSLRPINPTSNNPYRGVNRLLLSLHGFSDPRWMTYRQAALAGWQVQAGSKGAPVVKLVEVAAGQAQDSTPSDAASAEPVVERVSGKVLALRRYTVFNAEQIKGIPALPERDASAPVIVCEKAEAVMAALVDTGLSVRHGGSQACYIPALDEIRLPNKSDFLSAYQYYSVALHESAHATLSPSRMNRVEALGKKWGDEAYAQEELRAEIACAIIASELSDGPSGLLQSPAHLANHARYLNSWIRVLERDPMAIFSAAKDAELMSDYLLELAAKRVSLASHSDWLANYDRALQAEQSARP